MTRKIYKMRGRAPSQREKLHQMFSTIPFGKLRFAAPPEYPDEEFEDEIPEDEDTDTDLEGTLPPAIEQLIAALTAAHPDLSRQEAVFYLLHTPHGRVMVERLSKGNTMSRLDQLKEFAKQQGGMTAVAKHIIEKGSTALSEHDFSAMLMEHAKLNKAAGESDAAAFSRIFSAPESIDIRRAHAITKNTTATEPVLVVYNAVSDADQSDAYQKLEKMAGELRQRSPGLSEAQAFAKAFTENPELASKAHRRPQMTTTYAYPR